MSIKDLLSRREAVENARVIRILWNKGHNKRQIATRLRLSESYVETLLDCEPTFPHDPLPRPVIHHRCAWILGDGQGAARLCCTIPTEGGRPYCRAHASMASRPMAPLFDRRGKPSAVASRMLAL